MGKKKNGKELDCVECGAKCCRYLATEIDKPSSKTEYDHIRWYLLHRDVSVFIDHNGDWFLEFKTDCLALRDDLLCGNYGDRPRICRKHGEGHDTCEHHSDHAPHVVDFSTTAQFEKYLDDRKVKWRWKKKKKK